jgi:hypothetical protein
MSLPQSGDLRQTLSAVPEFSEDRRAMSRTHERLAIHRNLAALELSGNGGLGAERLADPFEVQAGAAARSADQGMEDL